MRTLLTRLALLGFVFGALSCEEQAVKPSAPLTGLTQAAIKDGQPIINPVPGSDQPAGIIIQFGFGHGASCSGFGFCICCIHIDLELDKERVAQYPVVGQGTSFISGPVLVDPKTHIGTSRIFFTQPVPADKLADTFDLTGEGVVITLSQAGALGGEYTKLTLLPDLYKITPADGSEKNPFGYVDVAVRCE